MNRNSLGSTKGSPPALDLFSGMRRRITAFMPKHVIRVALAVAVAGLFAGSGAQAALTYSGDLNPADPTTWNSSTYAIIGNTGVGSITVNGATTVSTDETDLGENSGAKGTLTVSGSGSKWSDNGDGVWVGLSGSGTLSITNGGILNASRLVVAAQATSSGVINVDGIGSTLTAKSFYLGASGNALLNVANGGTVILTPGSASGRIATTSNGSGTIIVNGAGSTLSIGGAWYFDLGLYGVGKLYILNGASVMDTTQSANTSGLHIGSTSSGNGTLVVDGAGSTWTSTGPNGIIVGYNGTGKLSISDGGSTTASVISINSKSALTTDVGSKLTVGGGTGTITNNGTVRLVAGAAAANGTYTPISAGTWSGSGAYQALGGVWNSTNHTVTVSNAATTTPGVSTTFDLSTTQRVLVDPSGPSVGAGFQAAPSGTMLTFSATGISGAELSALQSKLTAGQSVLSGWSFSTTGYTSGNPLYLSLFAGAGQTLSGLTIWDYTGGAWGQFSATDLAYNGTYASFTTTALNDFAVSGTAPVPIPGALLLFGPGLVGLGLVKRRFFA
jgi:T5SS/PEP-CTERM-associated repeat protein